MWCHCRIRPQGSHSSLSSAVQVIGRTGIYASARGQGQCLKTENLFVAGTLASKPTVRHSKHPCRMGVDLFIKCFHGAQTNRKIFVIQKCFLTVQKKILRDTSDCTFLAAFPFVTPIHMWNEKPFSIPVKCIMEDLSVKQVILLQILLEQGYYILY